MGNTSVGKTSLVNTFIEFIKNPTVPPQTAITRDGPERFTKVMKLHEGISFDCKEEKLVVTLEKLKEAYQIENYRGCIAEHVKLVSLKQNEKPQGDDNMKDEVNLHPSQYNLNRYLFS